MKQRAFENVVCRSHLLYNYINPYVKDLFQHTNSVDPYQTAPRGPEFATNILKEPAENSQQTTLSQD